MATKARPSKAKKTNPSTPCNKSCQAKCTCKTAKKPDPSCEGKRLEGLGYGPEGIPEVGRGLAMEAIQHIKAEECRLGAEGAERRKNVQDFMDECKKSGMDPIEVVKKVAELNGIDLTNECPDEPRDKKILRTLLLDVVMTFVYDTLAFAAQELSDGKDWHRIIKDYINQKLGKILRQDAVSPASSDKATVQPVPDDKKYGQTENVASHVYRIHYPVIIPAVLAYA